MCNITIPGLPKVLVGHVVPKYSIALLIGIKVLCDTGCKVVFTINKCDVWYKGNIILSGSKDPSTDLWTLPVDTGIEQVTKTINAPISSPSRTVCPPPQTSKYISLPADAHDGEAHVASFTHSVKTRANGVKFAHQSLCNPKILTLLKAIPRGFLNGCPNLTEKLIHKYLNASPATAKGHIKRPRHGIRRTMPKTKNVTVIQPIVNVTHPIPDVPAQVIPIHLHPQPAMHNNTIPNLIGDEEEDQSISNMFCFRAFADKQTGVVYNNLTGNFPFMSLDGSVCFLVIYHYKANAIFAIPIAGLDDVSIFEAYKKKFDELTAKGFKPK
jgi:hypothetical protein